MIRCAISPIDCVGGDNKTYIIANKPYPVRRYDDTSYNKSFTITDEQNETRYCLEIDCGHLGGGDWEILHIKDKIEDLSLLKSFAISPVDVFSEGKRFITEAKPYEILKTKAQYGFEIIDDDGDIVYCKYEHCYIINTTDREAERDVYKWDIVESRWSEINI